MPDLIAPVTIFVLRSGGGTQTIHIPVGATITLRDTTGAQTFKVAAPIAPPVIVPPVIVPPAPVHSPAWTEMPPAAQLIMSNGGKVTLAAGPSGNRAMLNGAPMGNTTFVATMFPDATGTIWQKSTDPTIPGGAGYWPWTGTAWGAQAADPRPGAIIPPVVPPVVTPPVTPPVVPPVVPPMVPPLVPPTVSGAPRDQLLRYLQSVTAAGKCLIGQTSKPTLEEFDAVTAAFGFAPAMMICDPWVEQWAGNAPFQPGFMDRQLAHARAGGIVALSLMLPNPLTGSTSQDGGIDLGQAATPNGNATNAGLNRLLDQACQSCLGPHKAAGNAVPTRIMFELDGGWFWWGSDSNRSNAQQTVLFRYIINYLRNAGFGDTILPTFAVNGGPGTYQYPGDDVVDIAGIDAYTDTLAGTYAGIYNNLRAQALSKLFALTEDGSGDPSGPDRGYNEAQLALDIKSALPRAVYANFWSGWGPNLGVNGKVAMSDPFWINLSQVKLT